MTADDELRRAAERVIAWYDDATPHTRAVATRSLRSALHQLRAALAARSEPDYGAAFLTAMSFDPARSEPRAEGLLWDDIVKFVRWSANVRNDTAEAIAVARALYDRILAATPPAEGLLDGIREEVRQAVQEGDAQDCSSPECIADAVYEIVRVRLRAAAPSAEGLREALLRELDDARNTGIRPTNKDELRAWNYVIDMIEQFVRNYAATPPAEGLDVERLRADIRDLGNLTPEQWDERRGGDPIARTINAVEDILDAALAREQPE